MSAELSQIELTGARRSKPYPAYRDSGVGWLGEVPEHWEVTRLGYRTQMIVPMRDKPPNFNGDIPWIRIEDFIGKHISDSKSDQRVSDEVIKSMNLKIYPVGTVLCSCSCNMGATAIVEKPLVSNQTFIGIVPKKNINSDFLYYLMNASSERLQYLGSGAIQQYLSKEDFQALKLAFPTLPEQRAIASFLDRQTAHLDSLVSKKERLIALLEEKRAALISSAVTKGLDPNVPMKDSGVEWLGEIPAHWVMKRLKNVVRINPEALDENTNPDYILKYVDIGNISLAGLLDEPEEMRYEVAPSRARRIVRADDVIVSTVRTYLKAIARFPNPEPNLIVSTGFAVLRPTSLIYSSYLYYTVRSNQFIDAIMVHSEGVGYPAINSSVLASLPFWFPLPSEQRTIASFLNRETTKIDALIAKIKDGIEKLREYRTALISAAVTGKIDVRKEINNAT